MKTRLALSLSTAALIACAASASAHDTYLLPTKFIAASPVVLELTSAEEFPAIEYGPKKARVAKTHVDGPDTSATVKVTGHTKEALKLSLKAKKPGTYVAAVELSPHDIDLKPDEVDHYFKEIDAPEDLRSAYAALPEPRAWKETYSKYAKTVACVTACTSPEIITHPIGIKLEFVAVAESLAAGAPRFRLLDAGAPRTNTAVAVFRSDGARTILHTDKQGDIALPSGITGPVLLAAVIIAPPKTPGARFTSDFVTLTFDAAVLAAR